MIYFLNTSEKIHLYNFGYTFRLLLFFITIIFSFSAFGYVRTSCGWYFKTSYNPNSDPSNLELVVNGVGTGQGLDFVNTTGSSIILEGELYFPIKKIPIGIGANVVTFGIVEFPKTHFGPSFAYYLLLGKQNKKAAINMGIGFSYDEKVYNRDSDFNRLIPEENVHSFYLKLTLSGKRFSWIADLRRWQPHEGNGFAGNLDLGTAFMINIFSL